jgi:hypothetical protein
VLRPLVSLAFALEDSELVVVTGMLDRNVPLAQDSRKLKSMKSFRFVYRAIVGEDMWPS